MNGKTLKRLACAFALLIAVALGSQAAFAGPGGQGGPGGDGPTVAELVEKLAADLKLTPDQKEKFKAHQKKHQDEGAALFKSLAEKQLAIKAELEKKDSSKYKLESLAGDVTEIHGKLVRHRIEGVLAVKKILTPEQYEEFLKRAKNFQMNRQKANKGNK